MECRSVLILADILNQHQKPVWQHILGKNTLAHKNKRTLIDFEDKDRVTYVIAFWLAKFLNESKATNWIL